jgi:hypothetical protein
MCRDVRPAAYTTGEMREVSEREFYAALGAIAAAALALVFVTLGVIPSFGF